MLHHQSNKIITTTSSSTTTTMTGFIIRLCRQSMILLLPHGIAEIACINLQPPNGPPMRLVLQPTPPMPSTTQSKQCSHRIRIMELFLLLLLRQLLCRPQLNRVLNNRLLIYLISLLKLVKIRVLAAEILVEPLQPQLLIALIRCLKR